MDLAGSECAKKGGLVYSEDGWGRVMVSNGEIRWWFCWVYMCHGLNSHYFHIIGDGHQPNSREIYIPIITIPIKGEMTIPNIGS